MHGARCVLSGHTLGGGLSVYGYLQGALISCTASQECSAVLALGDVARAFVAPLYAPPITALGDRVDPGGLLVLRTRSSTDPPPIARAYLHLGGLDPPPSMSIPAVRGSGPPPQHEQMCANVSAIPPPGSEVRPPLDYRTVYGVGVPVRGCHRLYRIQLSRRDHQNLTLHLKYIVVVLYSTAVPAGIAGILET